MIISFRERYRGKEVEVQYVGYLPSPKNPDGPRVEFSQLIMYDEYNQPYIPSHVWWSELPLDVVENWDKRATDLMWEQL